LVKFYVFMSRSIILGWAALRGGRLSRELEYRLQIEAIQPPTIPQREVPAKSRRQRRRNLKDDY
jgi:hypothetical protein